MSTTKAPTPQDTTKLHVLIHIDQEETIRQGKTAPYENVWVELDVTKLSEKARAEAAELFKIHGKDWETEISLVEGTPEELLQTLEEIVQEDTKQREEEANAAKEALNQYSQQILKKDPELLKSTADNGEPKFTISWQVYHELPKEIQQALEVWKEEETQKIRKEWMNFITNHGSDSDRRIMEAEGISKTLIKRSIIASIQKDYGIKEGQFQLSKIKSPMSTLKMAELNDERFNKFDKLRKETRESDEVTIILEKEEKGRRGHQDKTDTTTTKHFVNIKRYILNLTIEINVLLDTIEI